MLLSFPKYENKRQITRLYRYGVRCPLPKHLLSPDHYLFSRMLTPICVTTTHTIMLNYLSAPISGHDKIRLSPMIMMQILTVSKKRRYRKSMYPLLKTYGKEIHN